MSEFKYYQNRLEHFEKKFGIKNLDENNQNKKVENKITGSNKVTQQNLASIFAPVVNKQNYPKIESSSPFSSQKLKEKGFLINSKTSANSFVHNSLKEKSINNLSSSLYKTLFKNEEEEKNLPVIDSSKAYQFQE